MMKRFECTSSMEEVLARCSKAFLNCTGQERLFSRDFTAGEFAARRKALAKRIGPGTHALIPGAPLQPGHRASQDATFYYFTGLDVLQSFLLIDGKDGRSVLFLPPRDEMEGEPGDRLGFEDAALVQHRLEFDEIRPVSGLTAALAEVDTLSLPHAEMEAGGVTRFQSNGCAAKRESVEWDGVEPRHKVLLRKLRERFPAMKLEDASPHVGALRRIKSPAEIEVLRQAGYLSALIMIESMKATRPGLCESHLEAIAKYIYSAYGNCDLGYGVIAASGKRIVNGHYHFNNSILQDGEVVLMDCGPDLRHYSSDIARIWPVSGTYGAWHRQIYGFIVEYHKVLIGLIKPGILAKDAYAEASARMRRDFVPRFFPDGNLPEPIDRMLSGGAPYNHCVGLSVHDFVGKWRDEPIGEGTVFVVDPMAMFSDRQQYIRVEDKVVVTRDGCEILTGAAPIELDEVEALMKQPSWCFPGGIRG